MANNWEIDYYNFLVNNGMTKHSADQAVDYVKKQRSDVLDQLLEKAKEKMWTREWTKENRVINIDELTTLINKMKEEN